jgi:hypothetical protein
MLICPKDKWDFGKGTWRGKLKIKNVKCKIGGQGEEICNSFLAASRLSPAQFLPRQFARS